MAHRGLRLLLDVPRQVRHRCAEVRHEPAAGTVFQQVGRHISPGIRYQCHQPCGLAFHLLETPLNNTQTYRELADNKLLIKARVPDTLQFEQWLMSFGSDVEILKPAKLRKKFKDLSTKLTKMYKS